MAQGLNKQGYVIGQPGINPSQMTYAISYNANIAVPSQQEPSKLCSDQLLYIVT